MLYQSRLLTDAQCQTVELRSNHYEILVNHIQVQQESRSMARDCALAHFTNIVCLFALVLMISSTVSAQKTQCDQLAPLAGSQFQYKDRGNRCEGLYVANVGAKTLEVVSLVEGNLHFDLTPGTTLHVSTRNESGSVHVRALAKPPRTYYRMDAVLEGTSVLDWPVDDVLRPANLGADRLGIFAWKESQGQQLFMPVRVRLDSEAEQLSAKVYLTVRPSFDVDSLKWRSASRNESTCSMFGPWKDIARNQILAGEPIKLDLSTLKGRQCVQLAAQSETSNEWSTLTLRLELPK